MTSQEWVEDLLLICSHQMSLRGNSHLASPFPLVMERTGYLVLMGDVTVAETVDEMLYYVACHSVSGRATCSLLVLLLVDWAVDLSTEDPVVHCYQAHPTDRHSHSPVGEDSSALWPCPLPHRHHRHRPWRASRCVSSAGELQMLFALPRSG